MKSERILIVVMCISAMALGAAAAALMGRDAPREVNATVLSAPRPVPAFEMIDGGGEPFTEQDLSRRWSILFFGFTFCPDICPRTLRLLSDVDDRLADLPEQGRPQVVFVSVDPRRDTPERLDSYVSHFNPAFVGITSSQSSIDDFTGGLGVAYTIVPGENEDDYTVAHSAALFLVNPRGELAAIFSAPHDAELIAADFRSIRESYPL